LDRKLIVAIFFLIILLFKLPILNMPFHWDDLQGTLSPALYIYEQKLGALSFRGYDIGHPPFFYALLALSWWIFGYSLWVSHAIVIIFTFLGVYFTYLTGKELQAEKTGIVAAILLFFSPLYFAQSGTLNLDLPLSALAIMTFYFALKGNIKLYAISGICLVMTKVLGLVLILSLLLFIALGKKLYPARPEKTRFKLAMASLCILAVFLCWAAFHKHKTGWVLCPRIFGQSFGLAASPSFYRVVRSLFANIKALFFNDFRFILSLCIIYAALIKKPSRKNVLVALFVFLIFAALVCFLDKKTVIYLYFSIFGYG